MISDAALHRRIVDRLGLKPDSRLIDLGCGWGATLAEAAPLLAKGKVVGVDLSDAHLESARKDLPAAVALQKHDLAERLPFEDRAFDRAVCHNVLECLAEPAALLAEAHRVLSPGGRLVVGHADFDTFLWSASDLPLTRRLVHHHCDTQQPWMRAVDGTMGRKLSALVAHSPFGASPVECHVTLETKYREGMRGHLFAATVATMARKGGFAADEVERWLGDLTERDRRGDYFFSMNTYLVVAERR